MSVIPDDVIEPEQIKEHLTAQRKKAKEKLRSTGTLIDAEWRFGVKLWDQGVGRPSKYKHPDELLEHGVNYFRHCAERDELPIRSGLVLWLGFPTNSALVQFTRNNPEYRPVFGTLMTLLQVPLEMMLGEMGVNTQGILFRLKNIPDGLLPQDDAQAPVRYDWKERKATELSGPDGTALVDAQSLDPEEVYRKMLEAGARLKGGQSAEALPPPSDLENTESA